MPELKTKPTTPFSIQLEAWLKSSKAKTLAGLSQVFAEKSFAVLFVILLAIPALPAPTGGISHVFEVIAMLLALQVIVGRDTIWLPNRWKNLPLGAVLEGKILPTLMKLIRKLEKFSRPRLSGLHDNRISLTVFGFSVLVFCLTAFLAPPFSGLDTLPALGVVILSLGIILEDAVITIAGIVVGLVGITITVILGEALIKLIGRLL